MKFSLALRRIGSLMTVAMTAFVLGILPATAFGQPAPAPTGTGTSLGTPPPVPPGSGTAVVPPAPPGKKFFCETTTSCLAAKDFFVNTGVSFGMRWAEGVKSALEVLVQDPTTRGSLNNLVGGSKAQMAYLGGTPMDRATFDTYLGTNKCVQIGVDPDTDEKLFSVGCHELAVALAPKVKAAIETSTAEAAVKANAQFLFDKTMGDGSDGPNGGLKGDQKIAMLHLAGLLLPFGEWSSPAGLGLKDDLSGGLVGKQICFPNGVCGKISKVDGNGFTLETVTPPPAGSPAGTPSGTTSTVHPWSDLTQAVMPGQEACFMQDSLLCGKLSKVDASGVTLETPAPAGSPANTPATSTTHSWKELGDDNPALCLGDEAKCRKSAAAGNGGDAKSGKRRLEFAALASLGGFFPTQGQADTATLGQLTVAVNWGPWATPFSFIAEGGVAGLFGGGYAPWHSRPANRTTMVVGFGGEYRPCFGEDNILCWSNKLEVKLLPLNQGFLVEGATGLTLQLSRLRLAAEVFGGGGTWGLPAGENPTAPRADNPPLQGVLVGGRLTVGVAAW